MQQPKTTAKPDLAQTNRERTKELGIDGDEHDLAQDRLPLKKLVVCTILVDTDGMQC